MKLLSEIFSPMLMLSPDQRLLLTVVVEESIRLGMPVYLVGGVVRDLLLGFSAQDKDFDFIVVGDAEELSKACAVRLGGETKSFQKFLTAKIFGPSRIPSLSEVDFASARVERYDSSGALPRVERARSIAEDVARRDFTVNAIALPLGPVLALTLAGTLEREKLTSLAIDEFGGIPDLAARRIRILHPKSFQDDPTRIYRAARYLSRLEGALDPGTQLLIAQAVAEGALSRVSWARTANELRKVAQELRWGRALSLLSSWGVIAALGLSLGVDAGARWSGLSDELGKRACVLPGDDVFAAVLSVLLAGSKVPSASVLVGMNLPKNVKVRIQALTAIYVGAPEDLHERSVSGAGEGAGDGVAQRLVEVACGSLSLDLFISAVCNSKN